MIELSYGEFGNFFFIDSFMIELIKGKQDDVITKELIRMRQLEHSMLRFTRIFQQGKGNFQRDDGSAEYSSVMSEGKKKRPKISQSTILSVFYSLW